MRFLDGAVEPRGEGLMRDRGTRTQDVGHHHNEVAQRHGTQWRLHDGDRDQDVLRVPLVLLTGEALFRFAAVERA